MQARSSYLLANWDLAEFAGADHLSKYRNILLYNPVIMKISALYPTLNTVTRLQCDANFFSARC